MRKTITISVSDEMHSQIHEGMQSHFYSTVSEYMRFLVRRDRMPDALEAKKIAPTLLRTANQCIEDGLREIEADGFCEFEDDDEGLDYEVL